MLSFGRIGGPWGVMLEEGEATLWGPTLFEVEFRRAKCLCCLSYFRRHFRRPSSLVTITTRRLIVLQFSTYGCGPCRRPVATSIAVVPLQGVLGFCIEEVLTQQKGRIAKCMSWAFNRATAQSDLTVKVLTNVAMGKIYLNSLFVSQSLLPRGMDTQCNFEDERIVELRKWLGNVALFFVEGDEPPPIELWSCPRGCAPG
eukprot:NODE_10626_length_1339_cov_3.069307.p1 GENE.NODE_10626_length_1339_cov_3.069307~~NODE_10626_length_1339_cov_3.069307.p1  ORF type:complete len:200 (+),score=66.18 NODE_10626_length_1339_cov_3.069307:446-1045(+)